MKFNLLKTILGLLLVSSSFASFLKKTETGSCRIWYGYYPYSVSSTPVFSGITYTYTNPITSSVVYSNPESGYVSYPYFDVQSQYYNPFAFYYFTSKKGGEKINLSVIPDKDLENYDVKGKVVLKDKENKETWFSLGKTDEKEAEAAIKGCQNLHKESKDQKFKNFQDKIQKFIPEFLVPKNTSFKRSPEIKAVPNQATDNNNVDVVTKGEVSTTYRLEKAELKKVEKKSEEKKVEEPKKVEKKSEEKKVEEPKKIEKKSEEKKVEEQKKIEEKKVEEAKKVETKKVEEPKKEEAKKAEESKKVEAKK